MENSKRKKYPKINLKDAKLLELYLQHKKYGSYTFTETQLKRINELKSKVRVMC